MKGHTRSSSQRIGLHIPGPLIPAQDTSFMNKSNVPMNIPLDEPENIDENCNTRPRKSSNATKTQSSNKENEELKKLGLLQITSPKLNTSDKQSLLQKQTKTNTSGSQPKMDCNLRSKTPKSTQGALKQILSQTYYGTNKAAPFKKKDNASVTNLQIPSMNTTSKTNLLSDSRARPLNETVRSAGSGFFTKKGEINISKLSIISPMNYENNQGFSSTGNVTQTFSTLGNNSNDEHVTDQHQRPVKLISCHPNRLNFGHKRENSLKLSLKTPTAEKKDRSFLVDKTNLMQEDGKVNSTTSRSAQKAEFKLKKEREQEELVKKYEEKELEECTFKPAVNRSTRPRRSMEDFIADQMAYEAAKQCKTQKRKEDIQKEIDEIEKVVPPEIAERSRVMVERKRRREGDDRSPYDRLYERSKSPNTTQKDGSGLHSSGITNSNQASEYTFHPRIRARSQNLKRDDPVGEILYKDALRRQTKSTENLKLLSQAAFANKPSFVNESSKKMLAHKLIKEFEERTDEFFEQTQEHKFNYLHICDFLKSLRFLRTNEDVKNQYFVHERTLLYDMWVILRGDQYNGVNERNLLVMLLAILGLNFPIPPYMTRINDSEHKDVLYASEENQGKSTAQCTGSPRGSQKGSPRGTHDPNSSNHEQNNQDIQDPQDPSVKKFEDSCSLSQKTGIFKAELLSPQASSVGSVVYLKSPPQTKQTLVNDDSESINQNAYGSPQQFLHNQVSADFGMNSAEREENQNAESRKMIINFGTFDDGENISFTDEEVQYISQVYEIFYLNRLHSTERNIKDYHNYSFTPAINESSKKLANAYREKQLDETARYFLETQKSPPADGKLTHADLLIYQKCVQQRKLQEKIQEFAKRELDLCPFTPKIIENRLTSSERDLNPTTDSKRSSTPSAASGIKRSEELFSMRKSFLEKRDQSYVEWYDRKHADECTFKPAISKRNRTLDVVNQSLEQIPDVDKSIERIKRGRMQRELRSLMNSRGIPINGVSTDRLPSFNCSLERVDFKQQASQQPTCSKRSSESRTHTRENSSVMNSGGMQEIRESNKSIPSGSTKNSETHELVEHLKSNQKVPMLRALSTNQLNNSHHNDQNQQQLGRKQSLQMAHNNIPPKDEKRDERRESDQKEPLVPVLFVDVNFGPGKCQRIVVYPGDKAVDLANKFAKEYNLDEVMKTRLQLMLESQIGSVLSKIEEEANSRQSDTERLSFGNTNDFL